MTAVPPLRAASVGDVLAIDRPGDDVRPSLTYLRAQQCLDRASLVHRTIAFGHLCERQRQIEYLAGIT